jgi:hypothetical protein
MDQAGYSAPVLFNGQQGEDLETISLTLEDLGGFYWSELPTNDLGQAVDLAYAHPPFPGIVQPRGADLPFSSAYTNSEQSPGASLLRSPLNYADSSDHVLPPNASLPLSPAYTALEQSPGASLPLSPPNHVDFSGSACIGYYTHANELSLLQPQSDYDDIFPDEFPNYPLFNQTIPPQNSAYRGCQYPTGDKNLEQSIFWPQHQSNTVHQSGLRHDDNSNHMPSGFEQILGTDLAPVAPNSRPCVRCRLLRKKVFLFP